MGNSTVASSPLMILSRAGRLASGWSEPAEGDEGVSRGRFVDCVGAAGGGEADIFAIVNLHSIWKSGREGGREQVLIALCTPGGLFERKRAGGDDRRGVERCLNRGILVRRTGKCS